MLSKDNVMRVLLLLLLTLYSLEAKEKVYKTDCVAFLEKHAWNYNNSITGSDWRKKGVYATRSLVNMEQYKLCVNKILDYDEYERTMIAIESIKK